MLTFRNSLDIENESCSYDCWMFEFSSFLSLLIGNDDVGFDKAILG